MAPEVDLSGVGADFWLLSESQSEEEDTQLWPGIGVRGDGFVPVAGCSTGTGDPYFINVHDGEGGPLYRIYHDAVHESGYDRDEAIAIVLASYEELLGYICR